MEREALLIRNRKTALFYSSLTLMAIGAFAAGLQLRESGAGRVTLQSGTRLAQGGPAAETRYAFHSAGTAANARRGDEDSVSARRTFETIYNLVQQYYVDKLPADRQLSYGAIKGMIASLNDPHCYFADPDQYALIEAEQRGVYAGIGAALTVRSQPKDGYTEYKIVVAAPLPGSPAEKAGLHPGDIVTHVDNRWVLGYDPFLRANRLADKMERRTDDAQVEELRKEYDAARQRMQGGIGLFAAQMLLRGDTDTAQRLKLPTEKRLVTVERPGVKQPLTMEMIPKMTEIPAVTAKTLPDGFGYIRIPAFTTKTLEQFKAALATLPGNKGLILDLRGNPGGLMEPALGVNALLSSSAFGYEARAGGKITPVKSASPSLANRAVVTLADKGTASVAEGLAAALTENGTGTLVGGPTFGDSTIQTAFSLPDGSAFVLATGKMLSPRRADWAGIGLAPKIPVAQGASDDQWLRRAAETLKQQPRVAVRIK